MLDELKPTQPPDCLILPAAFFERDTVTVARALLGCRLWQFHPAERAWRAFRIVETEAYTQNDPACHAYNRTTGRAETLYHQPGTAYVYLIYGMYHCLNVVTEPHGTAGAVLFRALEPLDDARLKTNGPGRLTKALGISRQAVNGIPLTRWEHGLCLSAGQEYPDTQVIQTTRIGITKAADYPWRFYVRENRWVSVQGVSVQGQGAPDKISIGNP